MAKIDFIVVLPPFGLFCSVKYLNFERKLPIFDQEQFTVLMR